MITRSKKQLDNITSGDNNNNNTDEEYDEIDEHGNLKNFIEPDSTDDEDFDENMYKEEINRLRKKKFMILMIIFLIKKEIYLYFC